MMVVAAAIIAVVVVLALLVVAVLWGYVHRGNHPAEPGVTTSVPAVTEPAADVDGPG